MEALGAASEVVECLCELFVEVDLNGDGRMQWEEFTAFIIDNGMVERDGAADGLKGYSRVTTPVMLQVQCSLLACPLTARERERERFPGSAERRPLTHGRFGWSRRLPPAPRPWTCCGTWSGPSTSCCW